jgi:hypothetical protein
MCGSERSTLRRPINLPVPAAASPPFSSAATRSSMKAIRIHSFGGPEVLKLEEIDAPPVALDGVVVKIAAASINPVDYKIRNGGYPRVTQADLPITPGRDLCGVIDQVGAGSGLRRGDAVIAMLGWDVGGYAEFAVVPAAYCIPKPANLTALEAGGREIRRPREGLHRAPQSRTVDRNRATDRSRQGPAHG